MTLKTNGKSIIETLTYIVQSALPNTSATGLKRHLYGRVHVAPKSNDTAVIFKWNNNDFKATQELEVSELNFCNDWIKTEETAKVEAELKAFHDKIEEVKNVSQEKIELKPTEPSLPTE